MHLADMSNLSPTARVILGMLRLGAKTGYEIKSTVEQTTRFFWGASYGQIYPELRRLEAAGLVKGAAGAKIGRKRVAYSLTRAGEQALHEWLTSSRPLEFEYRDEGLLKLFFGGLLTPEEVLANLRAARREAEVDLAFFRSELEPRAQASAEEDGRYPYLALQYGIAFLEFMARWYRNQERALAAELAGSKRSSTERASGPSQAGRGAR